MYREKNCRRGRLGPRHDNFEDVKEFLVQLKICNYYKMNKPNSREIGFRGLF
jgi:hypothetical protein